ncbi:radical SAM protein [Streptomyces olivaceus]|uniref:radical SAM protein n=1 Tax=Streptomyces olivaceus TaxID=47716 RepID=UPI001CC9AF27|nr:radical SAM protein [Streptomyces olivaceus]MBZ6081325.1 radical SAM protein [Streptomyces olivaceus]
MHVPTSVPIEIRPDHTVRIKIIDSCGMACTFCHNEGTPVTVDNLKATPGAYVGTPGKTGRVSIYLKTNGAQFLAAPVEPGADFAMSLAALRGTISTKEVHFTGGEPTLHPRLPGLVAQAHRMGLTVGVTSNGESGRAVMEECAKAGLDRINLSVFGTTPEELAAVQADRVASVQVAAKKIESLDATVEQALSHGVKVSANIVVVDKTHVPRVLRLIDRYGKDVVIRMLTNLETDSESKEAIDEVLSRVGARPVRRIVTAGASGYRVRYRTPDGGTLYVKLIGSVRLPETCSRCRFNNDQDCHEGYYGVRLYRTIQGEYMVGVCIQRMDLCIPLHEFVMSDLRSEVQNFRDDEMARLSSEHAHDLATAAR